MRKILSVILAIGLCISVLGSCDGDGGAGFGSDAVGKGDNTNNDVNDIISDINDSKADISSMDFEFTKRDNNADYSDNNATKIVFSQNGATVSGDGATVSGATVTLTGETTYIVSGSTDNGMLIVDCGDEDKIQIVLDGVSITNKKGPVFYVRNADKVVVTLADKSENLLSDGLSYEYTDDSSNIDAALFSKADISFNGDGKLTVNGNNKHGICSKDDLVITGGVYEVKSDGVALNGKDCVKISAGVFKLNAGSDGIRSDNEEDADRGYVYISGGVYNIEAGNDGVQAQTVLKIDGGTFEIKSGGGSVNSSVNENGNYNDNWGFGSNDFGGRPGGFKPGFRQTSHTSSSSGRNGESAKGIKAGSDIIINGGSFIIDSADDSVHSNGTVEIIGGAFDISSGDDGMHADTSLSVKGGSINIKKSYEGLESADFVISGGEIYVTASDDGINAAGGNDQSAMGNRPGMGGFSRSTGRIAISGGYTVIDSSGDGIDSNGSVTVAGGVTVVYGPTNSGNGALDYDVSATITGGTFIAMGASGMARSFTSADGQGVITANINGLSAGKSLAVCDPDGNVVVCVNVKKSASHFVISSKEIAVGNEYALVSDADIANTNSEGYAENTTKTGGTVITSVTVTDSIGGSSGRFPGMGGRP